MNPAPLKISAIKLSIFCVVLLYLATDLFLWHGPVWNAAYGAKKAQRPANAVATVCGEAITAEQLARYTAEQDKLAGRTTPEPSRRASRLLELVRSVDLCIRTRYNDLNLPSFRKEAEEEAARLASRAESEEAFEAQLASQGYTRDSFTDKLEVRLKEQAQLERAIEPFTNVSDEEVAAHYEQLKGELTIPAARPVRHIFLATLHRNNEEVKGRAHALLKRLHGGEDFAAIAEEASEDARTAEQGGDLGLLYDDAARPLPELPIFGEQAIPSGVPTLAQSRWGWHILLVGDIIPARTATPEECRESIRTAIISAQRELAIRNYFKSSLREGRQHKRIKIYVP